MCHGCRHKIEMDFRAIGFIIDEYVLRMMECIQNAEYLKIKLSSRILLWFLVAKLLYENVCVQGCDMFLLFAYKTQQSSLTLIVFG